MVLLAVGAAGPLPLLPPLTRLSPLFAWSPLPPLQVVAALNKMADLLKEKQGGEAAAPDVLRDLAVYLTLEKAQARAWDGGGGGSGRAVARLGRGRRLLQAPASCVHTLWLSALPAGITQNRQRLWRWFDAARHSTADAQAAPLTPPNPYSHLFPRVQRLYGFDAARYGITDAQAAAIATVFTAYDADDNGVLSLDEFQRLW